MSADIDLEGTVKDLREKYTLSIEKNATMEEDMKRKEDQLEGTRVNLERAFENLVLSLKGVVWCNLPKTLNKIKYKQFVTLLPQWT